jgi:hypothetical protein
VLLVKKKKKMKIDKVILCTNNNEMYYPFWNIVSKVYKENFNIEPVLIFLGTEEEREKCDLSEKYGQIITYGIETNDTLSWECTWALFYFTKYFKDDVCLIMGIDQIPLGTYFLRDLIEEIPDDHYVMLTDDAYSSTKFKTWRDGGISPTAYHISKGYMFNNIYQFENSFEEEIRKIESLNLETMWAKETGNVKWGFDESYSSKILFEKKDLYPIIGLSKNNEFIRRRIDCYRNIEVNYNINYLKSNLFIECHSCRPYKIHQRWIDNLISNIPVY